MSKNIFVNQPKRNAKYWAVHVEKTIKQSEIQMLLVNFDSIVQREAFSPPYYNTYTWPRDSEGYIDFIKCEKVGETKAKKNETMFLNAKNTYLCINKENAVKVITILAEKHKIGKASQKYIISEKYNAFRDEMIDEYPELFI